MIAAPTLQQEVAKLDAALTRYIAASGKALDEAMPRQGGKLAWAMYRRLRSIAPPKGYIRRTGESYLIAGRGIRVRKSIRSKVTARFGARFGDLTRMLREGTSWTDEQVRDALRYGAVSDRSGNVRLTRARIGKRNWWQLATALELSARESARGFLSLTPPRTTDKIRPGETKETRSRWGRVMGVSEFDSIPGSKELRFAWGDGRTSEKAAHGLLRSARANTAMRSAINDAAADMEQYTARKVAEQLRRTAQ